MRAGDPGDPITVGPHRVLARLGAGGAAVVHFGRSPGGLPVAIKVLHVDLAGDVAARDLFRREVDAVRAAGGRWSPAFVDADPDASPPWLVTGYLPAVSLREAVDRFGPLPPAVVRTLAVALAEALQSVHAAGVVHLDLKPANVLLTADGPRLIDFGLAQPAGGDAGGAGSAGYAAPEQLFGDTVTAAADVYALGATLAFASTGTRPAPADSVTARDPDSVTARDAGDDGVAALVRWCMHTDPERRPAVADLLSGDSGGPVRLPGQVLAAIDARAAEMVNPPLPALDRQTGRQPGRRPGRRAVLLGTAGLAVLAAGGGALAWPRSGTPTGAPPQAQPSSPSVSVSAAPSPAVPRVLEFSISGDVTLAVITYTVDGAVTTVRDVRLPWRVTVSIPPLPHTTSWQLTFRQRPGSIRYRVYVDGFPLDGGESSGAVPVADVDSNGTV